MTETTRAALGVLLAAALADEAAATRPPQATLPELFERVQRIMRVGITGTRGPVPHAQRRTLGLTLTLLCTATPAAGEREGLVMHHGCCTGTDEAAHMIGRTLPGVLIFGHPGAGVSGPSPLTMRSGEFDLLCPPRPFRARNRDIVSESRLMVACPKHPERDPRALHSGTWQTVRLARRAALPIILVRPDGYAWRDTGPGGARPSRGARRGVTSQP